MRLAHGYLCKPFDLIQVVMFEIVAVTLTV